MTTSEHGELPALHVIRAGHEPEPGIVDSVGPYVSDGVSLEKYDPEHGTIAYFFTTLAWRSDCPACQRGLCTQRVEFAAGWDRQMVVHEAEDGGN
jgi:hypothetical protein